MILLYYCTTRAVACSHTFHFKTSPELRGTIPTEVGLMTALKTFQVAGTKIEGAIPSELGLLERACKSIIPCSCQDAIQPHFFRPSPRRLTQLPLFPFSPDEMRFHLTQLSGTMPQEICNLKLIDLIADCLPVSTGLPPQIECDRKCCTDCFAF